jgi:hypothetical protein
MKCQWPYEGLCEPNWNIYASFYSCWPFQIHIQLIVSICWIFKSSLVIIESEIQFNSTIEINSTIELNFAFKLVEFNLKFNPNQIQFNLVKINQIPINLIEFGWNEIEFHQMQFKLDWIGFGFEIQINSICLNWIFWVELLFWKF